MLLKKFKFICLIALSMFVFSCSVDNQEDGKTEFRKVAEYPNDVVHDWNEVFLQIERYSAGFRPGPAPRAVAYLGSSCV
jgi:hypothetical protein